MEITEYSLRDRISIAICGVLRPRSDVVAGWEGGSAAFGTLDAYSDMDLNFLVADDASLEVLYAASEESLKTVSPITVSHSVPPGRYYKLEADGPFLFVDLCFFRVGASDHSLEAERHGHARPLFDKDNWLRPRALDTDVLAKRRDRRYKELRAWFPVSQSFVRKAILREQHVEALNCFWAIRFARWPSFFACATAQCDGILACDISIATFLGTFTAGSEN